MSYEHAVRVAGIVRDAGGQLVGRTRLQKIAYLLSVAGLENGLRFSYKHYGPYSDDLATAARSASLLGLVRESEQQAHWGGVYSTYVADGEPAPAQSPRRQLVQEAASSDAIELELAATAVFLSAEGYRDPWGETARRKPEKAEQGRLDRARELYRRLSRIETPNALPDIV